MRVLITRPAEDAEALGQALTRLGHEVLAAPLLEIEQVRGADLNLAGVQALVVTSANGVRAFAARSLVRTLAVYCVGDATARQARELGFQTVESANGDVCALARLVTEKCAPGDGALLHPAGSRLAGDLAARVHRAGFEYRRAVLYSATRATALPRTAHAALVAGHVDGVVLFSPRTGQTFARLVDLAGVGKHLKAVNAYCLSPAVASTIDTLSWQTVCVAAHPDQASLLALLDTC